MNHAHTLQSLYDREINFCISTFFDEGFAVALGDETNGFKARATVDRYDDAIRWLRSKPQFTFLLRPPMNSFQALCKATGFFTTASHAYHCRSYKLTTGSGKERKANFYV